MEVSRHGDPRRPAEARYIPGIEYGPFRLPRQRTLISTNTCPKLREAGAVEWRSGPPRHNLVWNSEFLWTSGPMMSLFIPKGDTNNCCGCKDAQLSARLCHSVSRSAILLPVYLKVKDKMPMPPSVFKSHRPSTCRPNPAHCRHRVHYFRHCQRLMVSDAADCQYCRWRQ